MSWLGPATAGETEAYCLMVTKSSAKEEEHNGDDTRHLKTTVPLMFDRSEVGLDTDAITGAVAPEKDTMDQAPEAESPLGVALSCVWVRHPMS